MSAVRRRIPFHAPRTNGQPRSSMPDGRNGLSAAAVRAPVAESSPRTVAANMMRHIRHEIQIRSACFAIAVSPRRGSNMSAQGIALGTEFSEILKPCKGDTCQPITIVSPFQGLRNCNKQTQGDAPVGRLPWADLWLPLRGGTAIAQLQRWRFGLVWLHRNVRSMRWLLGRSDWRYQFACQPIGRRRLTIASKISCAVCDSGVKPARYCNLRLQSRLI